MTSWTSSPIRQTRPSGTRAVSICGRRSTRFSSPTWQRACSTARPPVASALVSRMDMEPCPAELVENGPASGASAVKLGLHGHRLGDGGRGPGRRRRGHAHGLRAGRPPTSSATMAHNEAEYNMGLTLPGFAGMFTRLYMERYGLTERDLALVAVKDHANGGEEQLRARADPRDHRGDRRRPRRERGQQLRRRAAAHVFDLPDHGRLRGAHPGEHGLAQGEAVQEEARSGSPASPRRPTPTASTTARTRSSSTRSGSPPRRRTRWRAIGPKDISFAELHDAFVIFELHQQRGGRVSSSAARRSSRVRKHETDIDGRMPDQHLRRAQGQGPPGGRHGRLADLRARAAASRRGRGGPPGEGPQVRHGGQLRRLRQQRRHHDPGQGLGGQAWLISASTASRRPTSAASGARNAGRSTTRAHGLRKCDSHPRPDDRQGLGGVRSRGALHSADLDTRVEPARGLQQEVPACSAWSSSKTACAPPDAIEMEGDPLIGMKLTATRSRRTSGPASRSRCSCSPDVSARWRRWMHSAVDWLVGKLSGLRKGRTHRLRRT